MKRNILLFVITLGISLNLAATETVGLDKNKLNPTEIQYHLAHETPEFHDGPNITIYKNIRIINTRKKEFRFLYGNRRGQELCFFFGHEKVLIDYGTSYGHFDSTIVFYFEPVDDTLKLSLSKFNKQDRRQTFKNLSCKGKSSYIDDNL